MNTAPWSRERALSAKLTALRDTWIAIRCPAPCTRVTYYPVNLLVARGFGRLTLEAVLRRLRCKHCGAQPSTATLTDHPNDGDTGGQRAQWSLLLWLAPT